MYRNLQICYTRLEDDCVAQRLRPIAPYAIQPLVILLPETHGAEVHLSFFGGKDYRVPAAFITATYQIFIIEGYAALFALGVEIRRSERIVDIGFAAPLFAVHYKTATVRRGEPAEIEQGVPLFYRQRPPLHRREGLILFDDVQPGIDAVDLCDEHTAKIFCIAAQIFPQSSSNARNFFKPPSESL